MSVKCSLIQKLMFYKFKLGYNATEVAKNFGCAKDEGAVNHSIVTRWFKKFCSCYKNLNIQASSGCPTRPKNVNSEAMVKAIEAGSSQRVSDQLSISQSSVVCHLHHLSKSIQNCHNYVTLPKYCKTFDSLQY